MISKTQIPDTIDLTLGRVTQALNRLGDPHLSMPPVIHVAGTNGKGSTIAFLKAILEGEGKRVHVYTSPHLVRVNERIVIAGQQITDDLLDKFSYEIKSVAPDLSYFEHLTCVAFLAFSRMPADYVLMEVGLGGRLDATNVVSPIICAITSISLDHQDYLGDTVTQIAREKAGILKNGKPVVLAKQFYPEVRDVIVGVADHLHCLLIDAPTINKTTLGLVGDHQYDNAATAVCVAQILLGDKDYTAHLRNAHWRGRLQQLSTKPDIWVDGAHNEEGVRVLAQELLKWKSCGECLVLCIAQLSNRPHDIMTPALNLADEVIHINMQQGDRFHPKPDFVEKSFTCEQALLHFKEDAYNNTRILFMGSLYMVGEILKTWEYSDGCNK